MECFRLFFDHLAWIEHQCLRGIRDSRKARSMWGMLRGVGGVRKSIHQSWLTKGLWLGLLCWDFKGVQEEIPSEDAITLQIGSVALHQSTTPSLSQTIWPRWASRQFLSLPIVQTLLPVTFCYFLNSEAVVMRQLRGWTSLWRRSLTRSHKMTSMGPSRSCRNGTTSALQAEEITSKGTSFMRVRSIKVPIRKTSGNLPNEPRIYIYIYIYVCVCVCVCVCLLILPVMQFFTFKYKAKCKAKKKKKWKSYIFSTCLLWKCKQFTTEIFSID